MQDKSVSYADNIKNKMLESMPVNILANIDSYNDEMTISQVVRFFERHGLKFTKTMIQNYVRVGIIPPPVDKRYYHKKHLIMLTVIDSLKEIYSLEEIGNLFKPIMNDVETFDDDIMDISAIYQEFSELNKRFANENINNLPNIMKAAKDRAVSDNIAPNDENKAILFLTLLELMVQTISLKKIINLIINSTF